MAGYYTIIFGKQEIPNYKLFKNALKDHSLKVLNKPTRGNKYEIERENYEAGGVIIYNYLDREDHITFLVGTRKTHEAKNLEWEKLSIETNETKEFDGTYATLYIDDIILLQTTKNTTHILTYLSQLSNSKIIPYLPDRKFLKRIYENADSIHKLSLTTIGKLPPNPGITKEEIDDLIKKDIGPKTENAEFKSTRGQNLKESEVINAMEVYSDIKQVSGNLDEENKFSVSFRNNKGEENVFYGMTLSKPKEDSLEQFEGVCGKIKRLLSEFEKLNKSETNKH